jgi:hypothetical protein
MYRFSMESAAFCFNSTCKRICTPCPNKDGLDKRLQTEKPLKAIAHGWRLNRNQLKIAFIAIDTCGCS